MFSYIVITGFGMQTFGEKTWIFKKHFVLSIYFLDIVLIFRLQYL